MMEWKDIKWISEGEQAVVWMENLEGGGWRFMGQSLKSDEPFAFLDEEGSYFAPYENGCFPTHFIALPPPPGETK